MIEARDMEESVALAERPLREASVACEHFASNHLGGDSVPFLSTVRSVLRHGRSHTWSSSAWRVSITARHARRFLGRVAPRGIGRKRLWHRDPTAAAAPGSPSKGIVRLQISLSAHGVVSEQSPTRDVIAAPGLRTRCLKRTLALSLAGVACGRSWLRVPVAACMCAA